jgi:uncharacterized heparinase superfamily protein
MLRKEIEFARRMTLTKLSARASLSIKRKVLSRRGFAARWAEPDSTAAPVATRPPLPPFEPGRSAAVLASGKLRLTFNNHVRDFQIPIGWHLPELATGTRLWKLNLHYMEFLEALGDGEFLAVSEDWIRQNPPFLKDYWLDCWNSYALSIRVVVWMQQLAVRKLRLAQQASAQVMASLTQQLRFLEHNLETDIGGNHLIKNIKALIWASAFFAGKEAQRWRERGLSLLSKELPKQILADGGHDERSASYHAQVFADLLECRHALGGDPLGGALDSTLHRMAQVAADLTHPDGGPVLFNDSGLTMAYSPSECLDVYERLFDRRPKQRQVFALEAAGYYGFRHGDKYMIADCGRIAPDDLPAHGHGDVLSFELSVGGKRMIVDQGVFEYNPGEKRQRARAASSHNTLCFEGADQAEFFGAFRCGRRPNVAVLSYEPRPDGFVLEGTHDGFRTLAGSPRHVRRFEVGPERIVIHDRIEGASSHTARIGFLLHPGTEAVVESRSARLQQGVSVIKVTSSEPLEIQPAVWWPDMGLERKTSRLFLRLAPSAHNATIELCFEK